jgi:uncharacterized protein (DUF2147 family)
MKHSPARFALLLTISALATFATAAPSVQAAEPSAAGLWEKVDDDGKPVGWFLFVERNGVYEGAIAKLFMRPGEDPHPKCVDCPGDRKDAPLLGLSLIRDMKRDGLKYEGGNIIDPRNGTIWRAMMTVSPDGKILTMRGYLAIPILGKDEIWKRLPDAAMGQLDKSVVAKYLPGQVPAAAKRPDAAKPKAPAPAPAK